MVVYSTSNGVSDITFLLYHVIEARRSRRYNIWKFFYLKQILSMTIVFVNGYINNRNFEPNIIYKSWYLQIETTTFPQPII